MRKSAFPVLLILFLLFHFPFLTADPDTLVDLNTRGAWTDEGLYAAQSRNLVDAGSFSLHENSTFVRGPLFSILQLPFFYIFGTHLLVARLLVLVSLALSLLLFFKKFPENQMFLVFLGITALSQFQLFQFSHYALAELLCIALTFASLAFLIQWQERFYFGRSFNTSLAFAQLFIFLAYAAKIQYLYLAALPSLAIFLLLIMRLPEKDRSSKKLFVQFGISIGLMLAFLLLYALWYFVNKDFYNYIMLNETSGRFPLNWPDILTITRFNIQHYLWTKEIKLLLILSCLALPGFALWKALSKRDIRLELIFIFGLSWTLLELHKLPMLYIPNRYLLSLFFALGILVAAGLMMLYRENSYGKALAFCFAISLGLINMSFNYEAYTRRTYDLEAVNHYLSDKNLDGAYVLGSWAPSLTWASEARAIPVWNQYFNWKDPINTFHPRCIITEFNEAESDHAYTQQGINLDSVSDSSRQFKIWRYDVKVYWIKKGVK